MRERVKCAVGALVVLTCFASLSAQTNDAVELDEIKVVSAAGHEQKIVEAPASISVITAEDLAKSNTPHCLMRLEI